MSALAELVACWICKRIVFRSVGGGACVGAFTGACCAIALKPRQNIRKKIITLADFMGNAPILSDVIRRLGGYFPLHPIHSLYPLAPHCNLLGYTKAAMPLWVQKLK
jgi:hypothetical protein